LGLREVRKVLKETKVLEKRLLTLVELYDTQTYYPFSLMIIGYTPLRINSKEELIGRIKELKELLNVEVVENG